MSITSTLCAVFLNVLSFICTDSASVYKKSITFSSYYRKNLLLYDYRHYSYRQNQSQSFSFMQNGIINVRKRGPFLQVDLNCCRISIYKKILLSSGLYLGSMLFIRRADFVSIGIRLDARLLRDKNIR